MAVLQTENFESGTNGAAVTTANTIWSVITGTGITYTNTSPLQGSLSCRISTTATTFVRNSGFSQTKAVFRWLASFSGWPSAAATHAHCFQGDLTTGTRLGEFLITTTGQVRLRDYQTSVATSTATLSTNTLYAFEWLLDMPNNSQTLRVYNTAATTGVTPTITITGTLTLANVAQNGGATVINQIQIGQMTNVTGMTHVIDGYQRADDWIATSSTPVTNVLFSSGLSGTPGNNVLIGDDDDYNYISSPAPVYANDGVDVTPKQSVEFAGASGSVERALSVYMNENPVSSYERFYFKIATAPAAGQEFQIWRAESNDRLTWTAAIKCYLGTNGLYVLGIWDGDLNEAVGELTNIPVGSWIRVEIVMINSDEGGTVGTFSSYTGNNKHKTTATQSFNYVFTNQNKRRRTLQRGVRNTGTTDPAFRFDAWRCLSDASPGPITDPFEVTPPEQYRFSEWNGVEEVYLTPTYWDGASEVSEASSYSMGDTYITGDPTGGGGARFPGDPGEKRIYLGWDTEGASWAEHYRELARWRAASTTGYPANSGIKEGVYRAFWGFGEEKWGTHGDGVTGTWTEGRQAAANCDVVFINYEIESGTGAGVLDEANAPASRYRDEWGTGTADKLKTYLTTTNYDSWINTLAGKLKDIYERYGTYVWLHLSNEPDAWGNSKFCHVLERLAMLRQAHRKFYFELKAAGVENFTVTSPTTFNMTSYQHAARYLRTEVEALGAGGSGSRFDAVYHWHPDWKGTKTNWGGAFLPNPADFYGANEMDPWGYGTGPIIKLWAGNSYCPNTYNYPFIFNMTENTLKTQHIPSNASHWGEAQRFFRGLYGKNLPVAMGEWGYPIIHENLGTTNSKQLSDPVKTANFFAGELMDDFLNMDIVAASVWIQLQDVDRGSDPTRHWLPIGARMNFEQYELGNGGPARNDDPVYVANGRDAKRKGLAAMFSRPEVRVPGTGKPLSTQHG